MASRDQRGGQTHHGSANREHHIKRRNRNFDPEMRIIVSRTRTPLSPSRGRSRSPVSKSIGDASSIKSATFPDDFTSPQQLGENAIRESKQKKNSFDDDPAPKNCRKVVRFCSSLTDSLEQSCKDTGSSGKQNINIHHPILTKEPATQKCHYLTKLGDFPTYNSSEEEKKNIKDQQPRLPKLNGRRFGAPAVAPADATMIEKSSGFFSPASISQRFIKRGVVSSSGKKDGFGLQYGDFVYEKDTHAINNATDLIHAASADPEEIRAYIKKNKKSKRTTSILSKFSNVEAIVTSLSTSSHNNNTENLQPKLSSSQRVKVQSLGRQGERHAQSYQFEEALKCYASLVQIYLSDGVSCSETNEGQEMMHAVQKLSEYHHKCLTLANSEDIFRMGREHESAGRFVRAANCYTVAFRIRRDILETTRHPSFLLLLNAIGSLQTKRGLLEDACSFLYLAQDIQNETNAGPIIRAVTERNIGASLELSGRYKDALHHYNESFRLHRQSRGVTWNAEVGIVHNTRANGSNCRIMTELNELLMEPVRSVHHQDGTITFPTTEEEGMEISLESSINLYNVPLSEKVVAKDDLLKDIDANVDLAMTLHCIGRLLTRYFENHLFATNAYINSLYLMKKSLGPEHPNVAALLGSIGNICMEREAYDRACTFYKTGLQIEEKTYGENHPEVAVTIFNIGTVEFARGNYAQALSSFQRTIKIQKSAFGVDSALIGLAFHCVGEVAERMNHMSKALKSYQVALEVDEMTFGKTHPEVGHTLQRIGKIQYLHFKNYEEAERCFLMALAIYKSGVFHDRNMRTIDVQRDLGNIKALMQLQC